MDIIGIAPEGVVLTPFTDIRFTLTQSPAADLTPATLNLSATSPLGVVLTAIVGGVFQAGWAGSILPAGAGPHTYLTVIITTWPLTITSPEFWAFSGRIGAGV